MAVSKFFLGFLLLASACGHGSELQRDEHVIFFPSLAYPAGTNWQIEIHGWVFEEQTRWLAPVFRRTLGIKEDELTASEKLLLRARTQFFLQDNERGKSIPILLAGQTNRVGPSGPNGHFSTTLMVAPQTVQRLRNASKDLAFFDFNDPNQALPKPGGTIHFLEDSGISVISDIDDTIKISQVWDKKKLMKNTFCRPYLAVPGMAAVYQEWQRSTGAQFHYVSAMPWQLYPPISEFMRSNGFPAGTFHCRYFRAKDASLLNLLRSSEKYKCETIEKFMANFPRRQFIMVGDSGENDPEVYGAVARKQPKQVLRILIRDASGERPDSARYLKAFDGLPRERWQVFRDARELPKEMR